jgi:3'-phosphoadenosine 5'-phosphosulfate sulfotransferase
MNPKKGVMSVSRLKTAVARLRRIERKKKRLRDDRTAFRLADHVWSCIASHLSEGRGLRLRANDDGQVLECLGCGCPAVMGSDDMMEAIIGQMRCCGIEVRGTADREEIV